MSLHLSFYQVHVFQCAKMFAEMGENYVWWKLGLQRRSRNVALKVEV
jgi:hypothetical protein